MHTKILLYRIFVFTLALGYFLYQFIQADYSAFGIQFRFLTIWALTANLIVAAHMVRLSLGWTSKRWDAFVSLAVVLSMSVVFNYWRLYLDDPANFYSDGEYIKWHQEYYLHVLGPLLLWFDAFCIQRVFRKFWGVLIAALIFGVVYPVWIEFLVAPLNTLPAGDVTNGLPYDFLNNMTADARLIFYLMISALNVIFILISFGLQWIINRKGWYVHD